MRVTHIPYNVTALAAEVAARKFRAREVERGVVDIGELARSARRITQPPLPDDEPRVQTRSELRTARRERFRAKLMHRLYAGYPADISSVARAVAAVSGCRFPIGDPRESGFRFCDAPREAGKSYCETHKGGREEK